MWLWKEWAIIWFQFLKNNGQGNDDSRFQSFCVCLDSYIIMLLMFLVSWMLRIDDRTSNSVQLEGKCQVGV